MPMQATRHETEERSRCRVIYEVNAVHSNFVCDALRIRNCGHSINSASINQHLETSHHISHPLECDQFVRALHVCTTEPWSCPLNWFDDQLFRNGNETLKEERTSPDGRPHNVSRLLFIRFDRFSVYFWLENKFTKKTKRRYLEQEENHPHGTQHVVQRANASLKFYRKTITWFPVIRWIERIVSVAWLASSSSSSFGIQQTKNNLCAWRKRKRKCLTLRRTDVLSSCGSGSSRRR